MQEKGTTEDEMGGWHHQLDGLGFGWTPGVGDGQGGLECCGSWGCKESDMTERLNWAELIFNVWDILKKMYLWNKNLPSIWTRLVKNPPATQQTPVHFLGQEDSLREGTGYPFQYSGLENTVDRGTWQSIVHGVAESDIWEWLSDFHFHIYLNQQQLIFNTEIR